MNQYTLFPNYNRIHYIETIKIIKKKKIKINLNLRKKK